MPHYRFGFPMPLTSFARRFSSYTVLSLFVAALAFSASKVCFADNLKIVLESEEMARLEQDTPQDEEYFLSPQWLPRGTNFSYIFTSPTGIEDIIRWLFSNIPVYDPSRGSHTRKKEFVAAQQEIDLKRKQVVTISVLVPHPKFRSLVEYGLVKEFKRLEPPELAIKSSSVVTIANKQGTLYNEDGGSCSVLLKLVERSVLQTRLNDCPDPQALIDFTATLDIARLEAKLES